MKTGTDVTPAPTPSPTQPSVSGQAGCYTDNKRDLFLNNNAVGNGMRYSNGAVNTRGECQTICSNANFPISGSRSYHTVSNKITHVGSMTLKVLTLNTWNK